jgi:hypothetical protein
MPAITQVSQEDSVMIRADLSGTDTKSRAFRPARHLSMPALVAALALLTTGCAGVMDTVMAPIAPPPAASAPPAFPVETLVGNWGIASFRDEKDRKRTENMARSQCKLPYKITKGPTDGVMMHVADDPQLYELTLKGSSDGKTFLGFNAPPGDPQDREILSHSNDMIVMRFVDPDANTRFGTFIYVRCKP